MSGYGRTWCGKMKLSSRLGHQGAPDIMVGQEGFRRITTEVALRIFLPYAFQNDKHLSNDKLSQTASSHDAWQAVSSYPNMTTTTAANLEGRVYPKYHGSTPMLRGPCSRDETKRLPFIKYHSCYLLLPFLVSTAKVMY